MPTIRIDWDDEKLSRDEVMDLSEAIQKIVAEVTGIEDTFVYANSAQVKVKIAPVEILVELDKKAIKDEDQLIKQIRSKLAEWKQQHGFKHPINLTLIPMDWKVEIGI